MRWIQPAQTRLLILSIRQTNNFAFESLAKTQDSKTRRLRIETEFVGTAAPVERFDCHLEAYRSTMMADLPGDLCQRVGRSGLQLKASGHKLVAFNFSGHDGLLNGVA